MSNKIVKIVGPDLSTRRAAVPVRLQVEALNADGYRVVLDFELVEDVTESYADELVGVLVLKHGLAQLHDHAVITNASERVLLTVARVVDCRAICAGRAHLRRRDCPAPTQRKRRNSRYSPNPTMAIAPSVKKYP